MLFIHQARLFGANLQKPHESSYALLEDDQYDYIENVDSASTLSTPPSLVRAEFGFANEDLGDTVIHLDKALKVRILRGNHFLTKDVRCWPYVDVKNPHIYMILTPTFVPHLIKP